MSGAAAAVLALVAACLPSLAPIGGTDASGVSDATTTFSGCGDGVIETLDDGGDAGESCDPGDASVVGCESCQFVCSGAIDEAGHCYFRATDNAEYASAQTACANLNAHVVTLVSEREARFASAYATAQDAGSYWVGLSIQNDLSASGDLPPYGPPRLVNEPGWPGSSNPCTGCFALGADDKNAFRARADGDAATSCLVADPDAGWLRVPCSGAGAFATICEREPVGLRSFFCGGAICTTIPFTVGRKRYVVSIEVVTADEARTLCETQYGDGGTLAVLESREEREQLAAEIRKVFTEQSSFWIGLSRADNGEWAWADGVGDDGGPRPRQWGDQQPRDGGTGRRAFLALPEDLTKGTNYRFDTQLAYSDDEAGDDARRHYICQRPLE